VTVTGAGRGQGRSHAVQLADEGAVVDAGIVERGKIDIGVIVTPMTDDAPEAWTRNGRGRDTNGAARDRRGRRTARRVPHLGRVELHQRAEIAVDGGQAAHGGMKALADAVPDAARGRASVD
jgi:hypothetical protein